MDKRVNRKLVIQFISLIIFNWELKSLIINSLDIKSQFATYLIKSYLLI